MTDAALALELRRLSAAVEAQADELAELREDHAHLQRALLSRQDRRTGAALVPLLADMLPGTFTAADAAALALNDRTAEGQAVRELMAEYITDDGGLRAFGRLLARLEGCEFNGARLVSAGASRGVSRWRVSGA